MTRWFGGVAALALLAGAEEVRAQTGDQVTPPTPTAEPSTTRSDEPAPSVPIADPKTGPATDVIRDPAQTPAAPDAPAATAAKDGRLSYDAAFFQAFSPANALQIVERVPGFSLELGDEEVRGFAQAAGNVVVNGQRPSSKSDTLETVLRRIPASRVLRVEVGRGDLFGAEFAGKPQVANLVLTAAGGVAGAVEGTLYRDFTGKLYPEGTASALIRRGPSSLNVAVGVDNSTTAEGGFDRLSRLPDGLELEYRNKLNRIANPNGYVSAAYELNRGENRTVHLNARVARDRFLLTQANEVLPLVGPARDDRLLQRFRTHSQELGGDYTTPFAGGGLKLIGLATRRQLLNREAEFRRVRGETIAGFAQTREDERGETLIRVVWNRSDLGGWSVETGVEGVHNRLESRVDLFGRGAGGTLTPIELPIDDATVEEYRGEAFVNAGRPIATDLRLDLGVTFEASELTVSGDAEARRVLRFVKPRATLDWRSEKGWHAQASVKRTVAQLQFEDFISVAELANERVNGGNAELLPQRAWELLAFVEKPILGDGLVRLELGHNRISLVQDRVPTPEGFDAPGNLGDGELFLARARVDAPLSRLGITGGRVSLFASYVGTSVRDPYTGEKRRFSGNSPLQTTASFRQDLKKFAWGFALDYGLPSTIYRLDELDLGGSREAYVTAFAEYRPTPITTITVGVNNVTAAQSFRERTFFDPDRRTREPAAVEFRERDSYLIPYLTLKHAFQ